MSSGQNRKAIICGFWKEAAVGRPGTSQSRTNGQPGNEPTGWSSCLDLSVVLKVVSLSTAAWAAGERGREDWTRACQSQREGWLGTCPSSTLALSYPEAAAMPRVGGAPRGRGKLLNSQGKHISGEDLGKWAPLLHNFGGILFFLLLPVCPENHPTV